MRENPEKAASSKSTLHVYKNGVEVDTVERKVILSNYRRQRGVYIARYEKIWRVVRVVPNTLNEYRLDM